jgi:hypothetical protein
VKLPRATRQTYIKVHGHWRYLYRAIDRSGALVDVMFSEHRDMAAAKAFFKSAKMVTGVTPDRVTRGRHDSYPRAMRTILGAGVRHRDSQYLNNRLQSANLRRLPQVPLPSPHRNGSEGVASRLKNLRPSSGQPYLLARALTEPPLPIVTCNPKTAASEPRPILPGLRADASRMSIPLSNVFHVIETILLWLCVHVAVLRSASLIST